MKQHMPDRLDGERQIELSALFDGESEVDMSRRILKEALADEGLKDAWSVYALIGDRLRGEEAGASALTANVMARLRDEPVVLAPHRLPVRKQHPFLALAASLAGVAVVGWLAWTDAAVPSAPTFAAAQIDRLPVARVAAIDRAAQAFQPDLNEYLLAHHMQTAGVRLGDGTERVRTISQVVGVVRQ